LVAREFRDGDASSSDTFSPTTPLAVVKMLIVLSLLHDWQWHQSMLVMLFTSSSNINCADRDPTLGYACQVNLEVASVFGFFENAYQDNVLQPLNGTSSSLMFARDQGTIFKHKTEKAFSAY